MCPGEAADPDRLRGPSSAEASEDDPMTYAGTMPLRAGEDTWDAFADVVVVLGEDNMFSMPLIGGSGMKAEPFCCEKPDSILDEARWSGSGAFERSMGTTADICMDSTMESAEVSSGGYMDIDEGMWWVGEITESV